MIPIPFPREVVRDLLGITRALYRAERLKPAPNPSRLARLEEVGRQYRQSLEQGVKFGPDTLGGRAALSWAERATTTLAELVAESELMVGAVAAMGQRLRRRR
jgi:hypothetical protein